APTAPDPQQGHVGLGLRVGPRRGAPHRGGPVRGRLQRGLLIRSTALRANSPPNEQPSARAVFRTSSSPNVPNVPTKGTPWRTRPSPRSIRAPPPVVAAASDRKG